ncbi:CaiB/BaiF CoA transferase family protein [Halocynthiibacter namhaensis]|uniref:CaiB/BaiF CoA transferase family protein n=1 Tax=Halocynthiibacter namhaensis TaxID=1290553 RepID=UPI0005799C0B|nr:CoA transferase [Halocynthiibacter namhaensis]
MRFLEGIRVLDLTHVYAGPFCTHQLGAMGAEVIKIEAPDKPDMTRGEGADAAMNAQGYGLGYQAHAGGKRSLALDLKSAAGQAVFAKLVATSDVVVQNYTTHCLDDLGLTPDQLGQHNPKLIYCMLSGFGRTGPKANDPAYDNVIQAFSGMMASNGTPETGPVRIGPPVVDYGTGLQAAMAISSALFARERSGRGAVIDVSMLDAALMLMTANVVATQATGRAPTPNGNRDAEYACYGAYDTADGVLMIGAYTNAQAADLMAALGSEARAQAIAATPRAALGERCIEDEAWLEMRLRDKSAAQWEDLLNAAHVPAARVRRIEETLQETQLAGRAVLQDVGDDLRLPGAGFIAGDATPVVGHVAPRMGADSRAILTELGVSDEVIAQLSDQGVTGPI